MAVRLKALLQQRHWQTYRTFCDEYDKAASTIDKRLVGSAPSRAQLHRWLSGALKGLPYPDHCRILEVMFPGYTADQLFQHVPLLDRVEAAPEYAMAGMPPQAVPPRPRPASRPASTTFRGDDDTPAEIPFARHADVESVYSTRSEFMAHVPPHALFEGAKSIRIAGLSLNVLCQQYADHGLRSLVESGCRVECLFLDPDGEAIRAREIEEGYKPGHLSSLTALNITILRRARDKLTDRAQDRLMLATYDETIRFNITLIDDRLAVVQPYLHAARGVEAPTLVIRRQSEIHGLYPVFEQSYAWLWERGVPV